MTINELKAKAYDILGTIQYLQDELNKTNQEIQKLAQEAKAKEWQWDHK